MTVHAAGVHEDRVRRKKCVASAGIIQLTSHLNGFSRQDELASRGHASWELIDRDNQEQRTKDGYPLRDSFWPVL